LSETIRGHRIALGLQILTDMGQNIPLALQDGQGSLTGLQPGEILLHGEIGHKEPPEVRNSLPAILEPEGKLVVGSRGLTSVISDPALVIDEVLVLESGHFRLLIGYC